MVTFQLRQVSKDYSVSAKVAAMSRHADTALARLREPDLTHRRQRQPLTPSSAVWYSFNQSGASRLVERGNSRRHNLPKGSPTATFEWPLSFMALP